MLKRARSEIAVHIEIAKFFADEKGLSTHAKLRLQTSYDQETKELGLLIEKDAKLPKIDEIIDYFEAKTVSITQDSAVGAINSLKAVSTAN